MTARKWEMADGILILNMSEKQINSPMALRFGGKHAYLLAPLCGEESGCPLVKFCEESGCPEAQLFGEESGCPVAQLWDKEVDIPSVLLPTGYWACLLVLLSGDESWCWTALLCGEEGELIFEEKKYTFKFLKHLLITFLFQLNIHFIIFLLYNSQIESLQYVYIFEREWPDKIIRWNLDKYVLIDTMTITNITCYPNSVVHLCFPKRVFLVRCPFCTARFPVSSTTYMYHLQLGHFQLTDEKIAINAKYCKIMI